MAGKSDTKMSALERARRFHESKAEQVVGIPEGVNSQTHASYWFVPAEVGEARTRGLRVKLEAMGYEKAAGDVFVPGVDGAEVWVAEKEVADYHFGVRAAHNESMAKGYRKSRIGGVKPDDMRPAIN